MKDVEGTTKNGKRRATGERGCHDRREGRFHVTRERGAVLRFRRSVRHFVHRANHASADGMAVPAPVALLR